MTNLTSLRTQIDSIDDEIIALLRQRVSIVKQVGELKKETSASQSFIRAGREANMLRDLTKKASGIFPPAAIATMWRMVISTSLSIEQEMVIHAYAGSDKSCFWLAREYFGSFLEMHLEEDSGRLIEKVAKNASAVGVLPLIDDSKNPWWVRPGSEKNNVYVFARIPFIEESQPNIPVALAIANTLPEATDDDISLFSISTKAGEAALKQVFKSKNLSANVISHSGNEHFLVETHGFIQVGGGIVEEIAALMGNNSSVRLMGCYAAAIRV